MRPAINRAIVVVGLLAGLACRYALRDQVTGDTTQYLLPWYEFAREHGLAALGHTFTNYTPFYSYLLLAVTKLHGLAAPWHLIKVIPLVFDLGCAIVAARLVGLEKSRTCAPAVAFAAVWLAPTVLFNGAAWGQADSIWTFFVLLSVYLVARGLPGAGIVAFGAGFAVKAQAVFLSPFIFGLVLRRSIHWLWLAAIPAVYFAIAAPAWLLGQSVSDIVLVYFKQAETFHRLSMNAANLWLLIPNRFYDVGVWMGLAVSALAGLALSIAFARAKPPLKLEHIIVAAALSLLMMPFLLPKMHDRYFYAFEVMAIVLAFLKPRLTAVAIAAQITGLLAYFAYYGAITPSWLQFAAIGNGWILIHLGLYGWRKFSDPERPDVTAFSPSIFAAGLAAFGLTFLFLS